MTISQSRYDETDGWIFSDEYHAWEDRRSGAARSNFWSPEGVSYPNRRDVHAHLYSFKTNDDACSFDATPTEAYDMGLISKPDAVKRIDGDGDLQVPLPEGECRHTLNWSRGGFQGSAYRDFSVVHRCYQGDEWGDEWFVSEIMKHVRMGGRLVW